MTKKVKRLFCVIVFLIISSTLLSVSADNVPYTTYTYSYKGECQHSPDAFVPEEVYTSFSGSEVPLKNPNDIVCDKNNNVYIADTGNNRVLVLNEQLELVKEIKDYELDGKKITLNAPQGVFADKKGRLYITDTGNGTVLVYNEKLEFEKAIAQPDAKLLPENFSYQPTAVAVDRYDRFYVISSGTNMGVITFNENGVFEGFIGAAKVKTSPIEKFWKKLMSEEQLNQMKESVPSNYNNLTVDSKGFVYVTSSSIDAFTLQQLITSKSKDDSYMPVKRLNPAGTDTLRRNGFFPPVGNLNFSAYDSDDVATNSSFTEVTVLDNDVYSVVDSKNNKIFTYDEYGNLLYAFGQTGTVDGTFDLLQSVAYQGYDRLLAIDRLRGSLTVFGKTEYGKLIDEAISLQQQRKFSQTIEVWQEIEKINNNYDIAYLGIGKSLLEQDEYSEAKEYFRATDNKEYYSKALKQQRDEVLKKVAILIPVVIIIIIILIAKFFSFANKYNKKVQLEEKAKRKKFKNQIMYGFHLIFHPFDGYWDLKNEQRGSWAGATFFLIMGILALVVKDFLSGYLYGNSDSSDKSIFNTAFNVLLPFTLWCIANWGLTSLMDGKGRLKDIYVSTAYAMIPMIILIIPFSLLSNFMILEELAFVDYSATAAFAWTGILVFASSLVTHDYSFGKNVLVCILTVIGIGIILFIMFLLLNVSSRFVSFIVNIYNEISFRL